MTSVAPIRPMTGTEAILAEVLADLVGVEQAPLDSHFFDDLGADSMMMAHFCARTRKRADLPPVSMKEIYAHPTIRSLARALDAEPQSPFPAPIPEPIVMATPVGAPQYLLCGALQVLSVFGYFSLIALVVARGYGWISAGSGLIDLYLRLVVFGGAGFLGLSTLPILAKWMLIGRWKPQRILIWSLAYVRFWVVKSLIQSNPLVLFVGSPIYVSYLRALGASIGRDVVIFSSHIPVCTDLLTIGDGAVIRKDAFFACHRARAGVIETGTVSIGKNALVGEAAVLDIETSLGDGAQLGHSSSLHAGQAIPDGEHRHGSPADQRTEVNYRAVCPKRVVPLRKVAYVVVLLLTALLVTAPLIVGVVLMLAVLVPRLGTYLGPGPPAFPSWIFVGEALVFSFMLFFGLMAIGLLAVMTVPRALNLAVGPDKVYPLYGVAYWAHRAIARITNNKFFHHLLGDSSYIVPYLRCLGYDLSEVEQTGSNFGVEVKHDTPYLVSIGTGTMAADGLSIINADYSDTSFRVTRASIGAESFLGNYVAYPWQARAGNDCLFATKVKVPLDGHLREGVGLLGSPAFEIPRTVERDRKFDHLARGDEFRRRLGAKNRHNAVTIGLFLLTIWIFFFELTVVARVATELYASVGVSAYAMAAVLALVVYVAHFVLAERLSTMFRPLQARYCSIYDPYFWWHERYWKLAIQHSFLNGTPFKGPILRLLGVRIGRGVFDDGCLIMDKTLVSIGDGCALSAGSVIQPHSQEDRTFKSDRIAIGAGCTLGTGALVLYGATMGDGVELAPDSFLMKGEDVPPHAHWGGNPARELRGERSAAASGGRAR
jgi:non-ribosomal peptide synthetase-like protein